MRILLLNIDGYKNYALEKIRMFHKQRGDFITEEEWAPDIDKTYLSCIFTFNACKAKNIKAIKGGSGLNYNILPKYIDKLRPKVNFGFTSRGCIRKCSFCIVPEKEGLLRPEADFYDIWDGQSKFVELYDNNILGLPDHFKLICKQAQKEKVKIDFNQGLDIRLLTPELMEYTKPIKLLRFAFDNIKLKPLIEKKLNLLKKRCFWYVFTGPGTTFEDTIERIEYLKSVNQDPYLMRHETVKQEKKYIQLARWTNSYFFRHLKTFKSYLKANAEWKAKCILQSK